MVLKEYLRIMNKMAKDNPEVLDMPLVYSSDDEGNNYSEVHFHPCPGIMQDGYFVPIAEAGDNPITVVCIN